jgi:hypothetical protein
MPRRTYTCEDGKVFSTWEEANDWEAAVKLTQLLSQFPGVTNTAALREFIHGRWDEVHTIVKRQLADEEE